jgi:FMN reductase
MTQIVVVSGNPRPASRTSTLAIAVGTALASPGTPAVIEAGALGPGLLTPGDPATAAALDQIRAADLLVVATPTYKGSYTGVLKVLLDQLASGALTGKQAVPVVTDGIAHQAAAAEALLRQLLTELGAEVLAGLPVVEADLPRSEELAATYAQQFHSHATAG